VVWRLLALDRYACSYVTSSLREFWRRRWPPAPVTIELWVLGSFVCRPDARSHSAQFFRCREDAGLSTAPETSPEQPVVTSLGAGRCCCVFVCGTFCARGATEVPSRRRRINRAGRPNTAQLVPSHRYSEPRCNGRAGKVREKSTNHQPTHPDSTRHDPCANSPFTKKLQEHEAGAVTPPY